MGVRFEQNPSRLPTPATTVGKGLSLGVVGSKGNRCHRVRLLVDRVLVPYEKVDLTYFKHEKPDYVNSSVSPVDAHVL